MNGYTKGPWVAKVHPESHSCDAVYKDGVGKVAYCQPLFGRPHVPAAECEANARLIAAAPELLRELTKARDVINAFYVSMGLTDAARATNLGSFDAAIAKALPPVPGGSEG